MCLSRPTLPSIRSIPLLAQHLAPLSPSQLASPLSTVETIELLDSSDDEGADDGDEFGTSANGDSAEPTREERCATGRTGRKLTPRACDPCKKYHTQCAEGPRPCPMCVRRNRAHLCVDSPGRRTVKPDYRTSRLNKSRPSLTRSAAEAEPWQAGRPRRSNSPYQRVSYPPARPGPHCPPSPSASSQSSASSLAPALPPSLRARPGLDAHRRRSSGGHSYVGTVMYSMPSVHGPYPTWTYERCRPFA